MAKSYVGHGWVPVQSWPTFGARYRTVGHTQTNVAGNSNESQVAQRCPVAGVFSNLGVKSAANVTSNVTFRKNSADSSMVAALSANQFARDTVNTVSMTDTDTISFNVSSAINNCLALNMAFEPTTGGSATLLFNAQAISSLAGPVDMPAHDVDTFHATIGNTITMGGVWQGLTVNSRLNNANGTVSFTSRINGSNGNQTVSIGAGVTGLISDTTNTDTVAALDVLQLQMNESITSGGVTARTASAIVHSGAKNNYLTFTAQPSRTASATVHYYTFGGSTTASNASETNPATQFPFDATLSDMHFKFSTNTYTGSSTWRLRKNGADGNQVVTLGAGVTGYVSDTSNTDTVALDDLINYSVTGGTSGGAVALQRGFSVDDGSGGAVAAVHRMFAVF